MIFQSRKTIWLEFAILGIASQMAFSPMLAGNNEIGDRKTAKAAKRQRLNDLHQQLLKSRMAGVRNRTQFEEEVQTFKKENLP